MSQTMRTKIVIRIYCGDEIAMGPGKAALIEAIREHGSISAAARALGMSYRRAWLLVDTMNRCWQEPLVVTAPGHAHGGGARVSPAGEAVLGHYRSVQSRLITTTDGADYQALAAAMLDAPKAAQRS